jgi:hypothetical protein
MDEAPSGRSMYAREFGDALLDVSLLPVLDGVEESSSARAIRET